MFQIYFYVNSFKTLEMCETISNKKLNRKTIEKILNEILATCREKNENK